MGQIVELIARMAGQRVYIDTNIFIFFLKNEPTYAPVVMPLIQTCADGRIFGVTGELVMAEVMVHPYRSRDAGIIAQHKDFFAQKNFLTIAEHESRFFDEAAMLAGQLGMKLIDAIHYRTAMNAGCQFFLTHDGGIPTSAALEVINIKELVDAS